MYEGPLYPSTHLVPFPSQAGAPNPLGSHLTFDTFAKAFAPDSNPNPNPNPDSAPGPDPDPDPNPNPNPNPSPNPQPNPNPNQAFKPNGYSLLAVGAPCAQNYMNHSRPCSVDNARIGGAQVFVDSRLDEAANPVEVRSTTTRV